MSEKKNHVADAIRLGREYMEEIATAMEGAEGNELAAAAAGEAGEAFAALEELEGGEAVKKADDLFARVIEAKDAVMDALTAPTEPEPEPGFRVAAGKAIATGRGILADGAEILPEDLPGGAFERFLKSGHIVGGGK